jgi:hypothetical protein
MPKAIISTHWIIEGTSEEIAEIAAEIDYQVRENLRLESAYHEVPEEAMEKLYLGTFISQGVK